MGRDIRERAQQPAHTPYLGQRLGAGRAHLQMGHDALPIYERERAGRVGGELLLDLGMRVPRAGGIRQIAIGRAIHVAHTGTSTSRAL